MTFIRFFYLLTALTCLFYSSSSYASPEACNYQRKEDAYKAADLAVTGKVVGLAANGSDLRFQVTHLVKGTADPEILLHGNRTMATEWNGFAFKENTEVFLLLHKMEDGAYGSVEVYNSACNVTYFVKDGKVALIDAYSGDSKVTSVPVDEVSNFFNPSSKAP